MKKHATKSFLSIGIIFLIAGFVQQGFTFDFSSGLFTLGFIFTLSGLVATKLENKSGEDDNTQE